MSFPIGRLPDGSVNVAASTLRALLAALLAP